MHRLYPGSLHDEIFFSSNSIKIWGYSSAIMIHINGYSSAITIHISETKNSIIPKQSNFWLISH